jgi:FKBP12-rapamycin complex-associated protein
MDGYLAAFNFLRRVRETVRSEDTKMLAKLHLKAGEWQLAIAQQSDRFSGAVVSEIEASFRAALSYNPNSYKVLHAWALINFDLVELEKKDSAGLAGSTGTISPDVLMHLRAAATAFVQAIQNGKAADATQDVLRLLTLAFNYGHVRDIQEIVLDSVLHLDIVVWLGVIPQIIARIHNSKPGIQLITAEILTLVGRKHPQALLYSLAVASKSRIRARVEAAKRITERISTTSGRLIEQASQVSHELVNLSVIWHEMWFSGINEASRLCYEEHNIDAMWSTFAPLYKYLDQGAETPLEKSFMHMFGVDLKNARVCVHQYQSSKDFADLQRAWDTYYDVFGALEKLLKQMTTIEVKQAAPKLADLRGPLELAVPGTYRPNKPVINISEIVQTLPVIMSKQRPRRLTIIGSNGVDYLFLLKAHEDLRQDERAMQLFGHVNSLLLQDNTTRHNHLAIVTYAIVPLSPNSGLIGWVLHSDTFHELIKEYRESRKIIFDLEFRLQKLMCSSYDLLTSMQKVEVLQWVLEWTDGLDFKNILWRRSENSEVWLRRRTNYMRSLAVMSMVGHILGIGDRHPSNLMLDRDTGDVIQIDFGDLFETAMHRQAFPEKIPFRLTRMLVNAMEVSGIEGTYRLTCEKVMALLRENRESILAMLETFAHDPLITWGKMQAAPAATTTPKAAASGSSSQMAIRYPAAAAPGGSIRSVMSWANNDDILLHIGETPGGRIYQSIIGEGATTAAAQDELATEDPAKIDSLNARALSVMKRVTMKLNGKELGSRAPALDVHA